MGTILTRRAHLAAFAAALVLFAFSLSPASALGVAPVLSATAGDGEVELSWTAWVPPDISDPNWMIGAVIDYRWCMRVDGVGCSADLDNDWTYVSGTSTTVTGLENGKEHGFIVVGRQRGNIPNAQSSPTTWFRISPDSNEVTVTPRAPGEE